MQRFNKKYKFLEVATSHWSFYKFNL